ncbi:hypothetical protein [Pseudomonas chlororaphis]|uniref:hypothetical protein n=1 Tax=Pseudomonas chlororaphis TaxID=587753 RepID=UPI0015E00BBE|nr:hypothetical protein [Pseudomonas chlororaphis]QLL11732.1 hypothetical protein H0I86_22265 [Pseudomonas chlororaphis subsp. aurantiaca]
MNTAMQICQDRHDNMLPPEPIDHEELVDAEVERVLAMESKVVPFFDKRATMTKPHVPGFALNASETMAQAGGHECFEVQLVLAVLAGNFELAQRIAENNFRAVLVAEARHMVMKSMGLIAKVYP